MLRTVVVLLVLCACTGPGPAAPGTSPTAVAVELPACGKPPSPDPEPPPAGAVIPPGTRITATRNEQSVVQLNAYVTSSPRQVLGWIESQPELEITASHVTANEVELLVTDGTWRTFVRARGVCTDASLLAEVIAPQASDAVVPTPAP